MIPEPLDSGPLQTQQQQEVGPCSQVSGSTGNKQAALWNSSVQRVRGEAHKSY